MLHVGVGRRNAQNVGNSSSGQFPTVVDTNTGTDAAAASTSATVSLPANIVAGDLLLMFGGMASSITNFAATGWTILTASGTASRIATAFRIADGLEGATIAVTWTTGSSARFVTWRIPVATWNGVTPPEAAVPVTSTSTTPDCPTLSPSWGAGNTFWIAAMGSGTEATTITA